MAWGLAPAAVCKRTAAAASIGTALVCALLLVLKASSTNSTTAIRLAPHLYLRGSAKHLLQEQLPAQQQMLEENQPSRHHSLIDANRLVAGLTFISHPAAATVLGCPVDHNLACFYRFTPDAAELRLLPNSSLVSKEDCATVFEPLPVDHGRPWCIREVRLHGQGHCHAHKWLVWCAVCEVLGLVQGREPAWLRRAVPEKTWRHQSGTTLLTGKLDSPNPTHQVSDPLTTGRAICQICMSGGFCQLKLCFLLIIYSIRIRDLEKPHSSLVTDSLCPLFESWRLSAAGKPAFPCHLAVDEETGAACGPAEHARGS